MKTWQKTCAMALGVIVIAIGSAYFLVKSVLLPETVRVIIMPRLEEIVQQAISYRDIKVGLTGTVTIQDIAIGDGHAREQGLLVKARDVLLHCRILPLLSKKIIIEQITLREPYFRLVRNEAGQFNFPSSAASQPREEKIGNPDSTRVKAEPALSLNIRSLAFQDGTLVFTDHFKRVAQPIETTVKDMNGSFSDFSPVSPFDLNMTAEIVSTSPSVLRLKATIDPLRRTATSDVKLTPFDISCLAPYYPPIPFVIRKGCCSLDLTLAVDRALNFSSRGVLRLNDVAIAAADESDDAFPGALAEIMKNSEIILDHDLSYRTADDTLIMEKCVATLRTISVSLKGTVEACRTDPRCDISLDADNLSAATLLNVLPPDLLSATKNLSSSGAASAHLSVKGHLKQPGELDMSGSLLMDKLAVQSDAPPRWKLQMDGGAELNNKDVVIKGLTAQTGNSPLTISGDIKNCFTGTPVAQLRISSRSVDAEEVINCVTELGKLGKMLEDDEDEGARERAGAADSSKVKVDADVDIERFAYRSLTISELQANSRLSGKKFVLESLHGIMGDGAFSASGSIGVEGEGLDCTCRITGNRLQLAHILKSIAPERKEEISGIADLALNMQGRGATSDAFKKNLTGEGSFTVRDGTLSGLQSLESVASFIRIDALKTLSFDESRGTFTISNGVIRLESSLKGKDVELYPAGTIGLDSALDIALDMRLAPQLSDQIADGVLTKYFKDQKGWTLLSLAIKSPAGGEVMILPASSTIKNITEMLADILLKKEDAPGDERQDKKKALEELLQKLMQKSKNAGAEEAVQPPSQ